MATPRATGVPPTSHPAPPACRSAMSYQIPLPVTTGLFLYLGVSGLKGNEMWERTKLLFTDKALRPKVTGQLGAAAHMRRRVHGIPPVPGPSLFVAWFLLRLLFTAAFCHQTPCCFAHEFVTPTIACSISYVPPVPIPLQRQARPVNQTPAVHVAFS